ncbi:MAG: FAD-dependent oxidoreductase [Patescibacteria group bacterium]|jgi:thioredoxin reductase (NADPH)|nr:FAD-dependent oxidoreductase [Patescibacteria group bacterium]
MIKKDLCVIGSGPAGLTAAVYGARYKIDQVIVGNLDGGLMTTSHKICNYPSETEISGMELAQKMSKQVANLEVDKITTNVEDIEKKDDSFIIKLSNKEIIEAKNIILATGTIHNHLGIENEEKLAGKGISYCATCDAMFYRGKTVAVIGGSDTANTASLYLANVADKVYQIYRRSELRGETAWIDQVKKNNKIEVIYNANVRKINGEEKLESIEIEENGEKKNIELDGMFVEIGSKPDTNLIEKLKLETDEASYIKTKPDQSTSISGVYAAGDITTNSDNFRQIITACSEGSIAAKSVFEKLQK